MTGPIETSEVSNRFYAPAQRPEDQSTAFSEELKIISPRPSAVNQIMSPLTDRTTPANTAIDKLPTLTVEQPPKHDGAKLGQWTNTALDIGLGTAAVVATEAVLGVMTKNPKFEAMALETLQSGGKFALMTSPKFAIPFVASASAGYGAAVVGRHLAVEGLTGNSESWSDSANHVGIGAATFLTTRWLTKSYPFAVKE